MKLLGWFEVALGTAMAGLWGMLVTTGGVPEIQAGRVDIWFHIAAEVTTAALLLTAGVVLLRGGHRGRPLSVLALGAVGYSAIASAGYYAQSGDVAFIGMFAVVLAAVVAGVLRLLGADDEPRWAEDGPRSTQRSQQPARTGRISASS